MKTAQALLQARTISTDVMLLFDEMYLQKTEEYVGGGSYGVDEEGNMYKGVICFMIVGLRKNVSYVIKSVMETKINEESSLNVSIHFKASLTTTPATLQRSEAWRNNMVEKMTP